MLEASNPDMAKKKKSSTINSKPYQKWALFSCLRKCFFFIICFTISNRYWPQNIVNIALKSTTSQSNSIKNDSLINDDNEDIENEIEIDNDNDDDDDDDDGEDEENDVEDNKTQLQASKKNNNSTQNMCQGVFLVFFLILKLLVRTSFFLLNLSIKSGKPIEQLQLLRATKLLQSIWIIIVSE